MRIDMEFKKLEIKPEGNWVKRNIRTPQGRKTMIYIAIGAVAGVIVFVVTQEKKLAEITAGEIIKSMAMGGFFGFFITNSPCARNQC
ncbi:MAG TPA: hypothetical protein DER09_14835 [Prolixibacteraceae bacterium]|nr:hypothetical protein [Prolixibacteraceae bacterium]